LLEQVIFLQNTVGFAACVVNVEDEEAIFTGKDLAQILLDAVNTRL